MHTKQYNITGMSCSACSARIEKAVSKLEGVQSCSVSLLTNSMRVEGTASDGEIISAVKEAGYSADVNDQSSSDKSSSKDDSMLNDSESPALKIRLVSSVCFLAILLYLSMGHAMWGWPIPHFMANNHIMMGLTQLLLTTVVMVINQNFFISGFKSLIHRAPNMDTLVALGAAASFCYSTWALFAMTDAQIKGDTAAVMGYMHEFYFEAAATILTLITVGKTLEAKSKGRTTDALKSLMKLAPSTATVVVNGIEKTVPVDSVKKGDLFAVRPGESIPVDGIITDGSSAVNEAALTGESIPVDKNIGDCVSAATINQSGFIMCEATRVGEDTTLSQIIRMVSDAAATKAPIAKIADRVSGIFVPVVIVISFLTLLGWLIARQTVGYALARAVSVLVISCPCSLGLATPVAIMVGSGMGAKSGILFKTAVSLEEAGKVKIVALDKTGTITSGEPKVTDIIPSDGVSREELLGLAYSLEQKSEHPLAKAIIQIASEENLQIKEVTDFCALPGNGLTAKCGGKTLIGGSYNFISTQAEISASIKEKSQQLAQQGKTPLFFAENNRLSGIIAVADVIKEESPQAVKELRNMGIRVVMLTGDNERTAKAIGNQAGVNEVIAGVLPDGKENVIRSLKKEGKTAMVGDGINDAPALTRADIGIAIGAGADVAVDAADLVLMKNRLTDVPAAIRLSRATLKNIHENLFWAFFYNTIGIPIASGIFIPMLGWSLNPMFAAAAMSLSSVCVVTNALRLNFFKIHDSSRDKNINTRRKSKMLQNETKTLNIKGMACGHCEARVKKALENIDGVKSADVSFETGKATVILDMPVSDITLTKAVEEQDYTVESIK